MNVLLLTLSDFKDLNERLIYTDLMKEFVANGHKVYIVSPRERKYKEKTRLLNFGDYCILKVRIGNVQKTNALERGLSTILLEKQIFRAVKKHFKSKNFDLLLYSTPPITFAKIISTLKSVQNTTTYLMLKDIFPQNAVDIGMFPKNGLIYKYFRRKEKSLYRISDYIGCMSQSNVNYLLKNNHEIIAKNVEVCPNSIDPIPNFKTNKNSIREKYQISSSGVFFFYGGNFGKPQAIDYIIEVLEENSNKEDRFFILCGTGTEFYKLQQFEQTNKPSNLLLINGLSKTKYDNLLASCDVGLIFLDNRFTIPNFPSRLLPYMEFGLPVLAATDKNTDLGEVIVNGDFGWWCESNKSENFTKILDEICLNKEIIAEKGNSARKYLENNYTTKHSYKIIMNHFTKDVIDV